MSYNPLDWYVKYLPTNELQSSTTIFFNSRQMDIFSQNLCIRNAMNYLLADPPGFTWEIMRLENNSFVNLKDDTTLVLNL